MILHPRITLEITLEEVDTLLFHEQVLESLLRGLVTELVSDQCFRHPIIVDRQIIGCWHRVISPRLDIKWLKMVLEDSGFRLEEMSLTEALDLVEKREAMASIAFNSTCFTIRCVHDDIKNIYDGIQEIEHTLRAADYSIHYETERDAFNHLALGDECSILIVPVVSKDEVVNIALNGQVFSYKTTRHVIPLRPLFINTSFEWLNNSLSPEHLNTSFTLYLSKKQFERFPPNQIFDRRYDEELHVFK